MTADTEMTEKNEGNQEVGREGANEMEKMGFRFLFVTSLLIKVTFKLHLYHKR